MSTNYFTPILNGASNDASTVNDPMGELDAAITTINENGAAQSGQTWSYAGDMYIEPLGAADSTLYIRHTSGLYEASIDVEGGGTFGQPVLLDDGTTGAPALTFTADTNTGIYRQGDDSMSIIAGGDEVMRFSESPIRVWTLFFGQTSGPDGDAVTPTYSFNSETTTGIYYPASGEIGFSSSGSQVGKWSSSGLDVTGSITVSGTVDGVDIAARDHDAVTLVDNSGASAISLSGQQITLADVFLHNSGTETGAADYTWTGDSTFATGGVTALHVNNTGNAATANVGILTNTPDAQFALDVDGPIRGTYLIGELARTIKQAGHIWNFDGPPDPAQHGGSYLSHKGLGPTSWTPAATTPPYFIPGRFSQKALVSAEGTTNLVPNPVGAYDAGGTSWAAGAGSVTLDGRVADSDFIGGYAIELHTTALDQAECTVPSGSSYRVAATSSDTLGFQCRIWCDVTATWQVELKQYDASHVAINNTSPVSLGQISGGSASTVFATLTPTNSGGTVAYVEAYITTTANIASGSYFRVGQVQIEKKASPTPFMYGDATRTEGWSGTAHLSSSTRANQTIRYGEGTGSDPGFYWQRAWTMLGWVQVHSDTGSSADTGHTNIILQIGTYQDASNPSLTLQKLYDQGQPGIYWDYTGSSWEDTAAFTGFTADAGDWIFYAIVHSGTGGNHTAYLWNVSNEDASPTTASVSGTEWDDSTHNLSFGSTNGQLTRNLYDTQALVYRALDQDELTAIYESDAPVFAPSSSQSFRAGSHNTIYADQNGLWAETADGQEVLGVAITDSNGWGGTTLNTGDFLLGNTGDAGYLFWDKSGPSLTIKGDVTATTGTLTTLDVDGVITVGSGGSLQGGSGQQWQLDDIGLLMRTNTAASTGRMDWYTGGTLNGNVAQLSSVISAESGSGNLDFVWEINPSGTATSGDVTWNLEINGSSNRVALDMISDTTSDRAVFSIAGTSELQVDGSGVKPINVGNSATCYTDASGYMTSTAPSSRLLKADIEPLAPEPGLLQKLAPVAFKWRQDGRQDVGLILEDVREVIPGICEDDGYRPDRLVFYLLAALKEQETRIQALEKGH